MTWTLAKRLAEGDLHLEPSPRHARPQRVRDMRHPRGALRRPPARRTSVRGPGTRRRSRSRGKDTRDRRHRSAPAATGRDLPAPRDGRCGSGAPARRAGRLDGGRVEHRRLQRLPGGRRNLRHAFFGGPMRLTDRRRPRSRRSTTACVAWVPQCSSRKTVSSRSIGAGPSCVTRSSARNPRVWLRERAASRSGVESSTRMTIRTLIPVAEGLERLPTGKLSARKSSLAGETVGVVWNRLGRSDWFFDALVDELAATDDLRGVERVTKPSQSVPPAPLDWDRLMTTSVAVSGFGGCGSCSARSMRDAIELDWAGIRSVWIGHRSVEASARAVAKLAGHADYPMVFADYPYVPTPARGSARKRRRSPGSWLLQYASALDGGAVVTSAPQPPPHASSSTTRLRRRWAGLLRTRMDGWSADRPADRRARSTSWTSPA